MTNGAHLVTPSTRQVPPQCYDPKIKCRSRMHYYLAEQEARLVDPEASALLLDLAGNVTETNTGNFLLVERGRILSPTTVNTLPGISRGARPAGLSRDERRRGHADKYAVLHHAGNEDQRLAHR
jgi:branched-subunit amino acid aminotransferase/4-amino-4-deoxychorismate lyase